MKGIHFTFFCILFLILNLDVVNARALSVQAAKHRVVAIGDVHGDFGNMKKVIKLTGVMNDKNQWTGGETVLVQVGDQLDRGDGERGIIDLLENLNKQAQKVGGAVLVLNGNHETMNVDLDFRYVTEKGAKAFATFFTNTTKVDSILEKIPDNLKGRAVAFRPGGPYANLLANHNTVLIIGNSLFVHGAVTPKFAKYGIEKINSEIQKWMQNKKEKPNFLDDENGPLWSRKYSKDVSKKDCKSLKKSLSILGIKRMIVAHTVQKNGINSACGGKVWRIDTGISSHYDGKLEALEIIDDKKINILK